MAQPADATGAPRKRAAKRRASERARPCFCKPSGDTPPAKKRKSDHTTSEVKVVEVATQVKCPTRATKRRRPSASDDGSSPESGKETFEPSAKRRRLSTVDVAAPQVGPMPCGTKAYSFKETPPLSLKTSPYLRGRNGKQSIKPASDTFLAARPPESTPLEGSNMGRPVCTAEEDVQRGEKVKYQQLVEVAKEKYPRSQPTPQLTSFSNVQACSKEPPMTYLAAPRLGGDVCPRAPPMTSVKYIDISCAEPQDVEMTSCSPPPEELQERAVAGKNNGAALDVGKKDLPSLEKPAEGFIPLTEAMEREVTAAFANGQPEEIMSTFCQLKVTREDIQTLRNLCRLNEEVINFYLRLVVERNKKAGYPAVHAFSTSFYSKLSAWGYKAVKRCTRDMDLFQQDIILVPVHFRLHGTLAVIDVRKKVIKHFDSVAQKGDAICRILLKYLQEESRDKRHVELNVSEWTIHSLAAHEIPQQSSGNDCGVFTCQYADYVSQDKPINFTEAHIPYLRRKMVWEILHQHLLGDMHH